MEPINIALSLDSPDARRIFENAAHENNLVAVLDYEPGLDHHLFAQQVALLRPDIVILETSRLWGPVGEVVQSLRASQNSPKVVILHSSPDPEVILEAMRAGATEFVYPPYELNLSSTLQRLCQQYRGKGRPLGKTIGFLSVKGGCGATTLACNLAADFSQAWSKSVLLTDLDPDIGVISFLMKTKSLYSASDALENANLLDHSMWQAFVAQGPSRVDVLAGPDDSGPIIADADQSGRFFRFVRSEYDVTVVDLGRGITRLNTVAMADLDATCLVANMDIPSLHRARRTIKALLDNGHPPARLHLIVNRIARRQEVTFAELEKLLGFPVYAWLPEDEEAISEAHAERGIASFGTAFRKRISTLAALLLGQPEKEQRRFRLFSRAG